MHRYLWFSLFILYSSVLLTNFFDRELESQTFFCGRNQYMEPDVPRNKGYPLSFKDLFSLLDFIQFIGFFGSFAWAMSYPRPCTLMCPANIFKLSLNALFRKCTACVVGWVENLMFRLMVLVLAPHVDQICFQCGPRAKKSCPHPF